MSVLERDEHVAHGHSEHHHEEGFLRKYVFSQDHKVIGMQYGFTALCFLLFGFTLMLLMRWQLAFPGKPIPVIGKLARRGQRAGRHHAAGVLQPARRHARHDHGVPGHRAAGGRRVRQLRRAAPDRRARHGVPQAQHGELLGLLHRRRGDVLELLRPGRRRQLRLDVVPATVGNRDHRADRVVARHGVPDHVVAPRLGELHRHDLPAARQGAVVHAPAVLRLGAARDLVPAPARLPAARGGGGHAAHGPRGRHELLPAERPGGHRPGAGQLRRRQPAALAAPLLVPRPPRGLRAHPAGHRHRRRGDRQQHPQAAVGLQGDGRRHRVPRLHVLRRLGPPHVHDRHGHGDHRRSSRPPR